MSKFFSRKVNADGQSFDSKKEYNRYCELSLLERCGKITDLRRQVKYVLIPTQSERFERYSQKTGKRLKDGIRVLEKETAYVADFVYYRDGELVVEDVKGYRKGAAYELFAVKRKLMLYFHGIRIQEV